MNRRNLLGGFGATALPYSAVQASASAAEDYNRLLFNWTNNYRSVHGVQLIEPSAEAAQHCHWKTRRLYDLDLRWPHHDIPTVEVGVYDKLPQQVVRNGVDLYRYGGTENLSYQAPHASLTERLSLQRCFESLVHSTRGHYEAMVSPEHTHLGVDAYCGSDGGMYIAQLFLYPNPVRAPRRVVGTVSEVSLRR